MTESELVSTEVGKKKEPDFFHLKTRVNRQIKKRVQAKLKNPKQNVFIIFLYE